MPWHKNFGHFCPSDNSTCESTGPSGASLLLCLLLHFLLSALPDTGNILQEKVFLIGVHYLSPFLALVMPPERTKETVPFLFN
jgi:hypothetical protein